VLAHGESTQNRHLTRRRDAWQNMKQWTEEPGEGSLLIGFEKDRLKAGGARMKQKGGKLSTSRTPKSLRTCGAGLELEEPGKGRQGTGETHRGGRKALG